MQKCEGKKSVGKVGIGEVIHGLNPLPFQAYPHSANGITWAHR